MSGFNPDAEKHPCMECKYGSTWTEHGKIAGNVCQHPEITKQKGLYYGLYFTCKSKHNRCPVKPETR
jgi:hypothetical protein